jgi:hypothetical protein
MNKHRSTSFPLGVGALGGANCFLHFTIELFPITLLVNSKVNIQVQPLDHIQLVHCASFQDKQTDGTMHPNAAVMAMLGVTIGLTHPL